MNKKVLIIGAFAVLIIVYMVVQEFRHSGSSTDADTPAPVQTAQTELNVEDAESNQIAKEVKNAAVSKNYLVKCAPCHNRDGSGPVGAAITGFTKDELVKKLMAYKNGDSANNLMHGLMQNISGSEIEQLSEEISKF